MTKLTTLVILKMEEGKEVSEQFHFLLFSLSNFFLAKLFPEMVILFCMIENPEKDLIGLSLLALFNIDDPLSNALSNPLVNLFQ